MEDNPNNQLLDQLPTQDEIIQINNNNDQTPSDYIPPPINENNNNINKTPQEIPPQQEYPPIEIQTPQQKPNSIYEELKIKDPLSHNLITPKTNIDNTNNINSINNNPNQIDEPITYNHSRKNGNRRSRKEI